MDTLFDLAREALHCCSFDGKKKLIASIFCELGNEQFDVTGQVAPERISQAGRPSLPILVPPTEVKRRRLGSIEGRVALIHAVAHIELNAVNFALDAIYRFRGMPHQYYRDWIRVASEEATHFELLSERLRQLSSYYGELPAHGGMWAMAVATDYDVMARMALVPRVLEARGLDVTPGMIEKLRGVGDLDTVSIFQRILKEEVDHVRIGNEWFGWVCERRGLCALTAFKDLLQKHGRIALRGPFNEQARLDAGFTREELKELHWLEQEFRGQLQPVS
ncbi:hypothetical protein AB833_20150 [Chromatiales bacterium (ex Bugula neritina AB1)]|nr:hypothetical protein AB833_20150 [Chromatiales bacterium (ex Bugula neritina AB1)]